MLFLGHGMDKTTTTYIFNSNALLLFLHATSNGKSIQLNSIPNKHGIAFRWKIQVNLIKLFMCRNEKREILDTRKQTRDWKMHKCDNTSKWSIIKHENWMAKSLLDIFFFLKASNSMAWKINGHQQRKIYHFHLIALTTHERGLCRIIADNPKKQSRNSYRNLCACLCRLWVQSSCGKSSSSLSFCLERKKREADCILNKVSSIESSSSSSPKEALSRTRGKPKQKQNAERKPEMKSQTSQQHTKMYFDVTLVLAGCTSTFFSSFLVQKSK